MKRIKRHIAVLCALLLLTGVTSCLRELFIAGDAFHSIVLHLDWSQYQNGEPDGITAWFFPDDPSVPVSRFTTSQVKDPGFYLPAGNYTGVVIDYSPEEYAMQEFVSMEHASTALARLTQSGWQPLSGTELYGPPCFGRPLDDVSAQTGLYQLFNLPEMMALDTVRNIVMTGGVYQNFIPYSERESYQNTLRVKEYTAIPQSPVCQMQIRIPVKGIDYLGSVEATVAGLAQGYFLARNQSTDTPCLMALNEWEIHKTGDNEGYLYTRFNTFGLLASQRGDTKAEDLALNSEDIRINLRLLLRDQSTVLFFHFDVGDKVTVSQDLLRLTVSIPAGSPLTPDLPYVAPYNGAGFDADVTPWTDGGSAEVDM